ncbi:competence protein CoiA family protein [Streptomyces sp. BE147]|uniref:competence protein CoiA family protein n=1 Tax=Streptomyces sp. BE147 TaxID=3002524 RepID=UPI002E773740|nr:competence protein CoiA family protein [Streptomyces sp. BE147]MEE1736435.1 competence protein CoiA family protein [Streptomyces sp. BE147]
MDDLLVVGLDLRTGREVHVSEQPGEYWRTCGYPDGDGSLVCFYCYNGMDAAPGTRVPLVARGRLGGKVRLHFAHPPGRAPAAGHHPETVWHLTAKHVLARWARTQPEVTGVSLEQWAPPGSRRADVLVTLADGTRLALEVQKELLDGHFQARHHDYAARNIRDVWFWRPGLQVPHAALAEGLPVWFLDSTAAQVTTLVARPHVRPYQWWQLSDLAPFAPHHPPCAMDPTEKASFALGDLSLDRLGASLPGALRDKLREDHRKVEKLARQRANEAGRAALERFARGSRLRPRLAPRLPGQTVPRRSPRPVTGTAPAPKPECEGCGKPLASTLTPYGRHLLC